MRAFVLSLYDLGRVPLEARAVADRIGARLLQPGIDELSCIQGAEVVVLMIGMHTAARLAQEVLPEIRAIAPHARVATTGLYAELVDLQR